MTDLLDSIWRQYPIGSLLAWDTDTTVGSLERIGPVLLGGATSETASFLLDGHQRLSTLAGALVATGDRTESTNDALWNIYFNANTETFEHLPLGVDPDAHQFPTAKVFDTIEFLAECQRVLAQDPVNGPGYVQQFQELSRIFYAYKVPVIRIEQTGATEAVEIFARLNSKGQAMTADQMVSALLYREGDEESFDLGSDITRITSLLGRRGFGDLNRDHILRIFLGAAGEDIYRTDWSRIASNRRSELLERIRAVIPDVEPAVESAISFLRDELGVPTQRLLPYAQQIVVLATFFFAKPSPSAAQKSLLAKWFWVTSFTEWFGSANPSRVNALVRDFMDRVARDETTPSLTAMRLDVSATPIPEAFDMRSARTKATLLVLLAQSPRARDGSIMVDLPQRLEASGPSAVTYIVWNQRGMSLGGSPANRIFVDDVDDRRQGKGWLLELDTDQRELVLRSHAITSSAIEFLREGDTAAFLAARLEEIERLEREFLEARSVHPVDVLVTRRPPENPEAIEDTADPVDVSLS
jgi:hypothetical protein